MINAIKNVLEYVDALHSKVIKTLNTTRESFRGSFSSHVQREQILFTLEVAAVSKPFVNSVGEILLKLRERILECEAVAKVRFIFLKIMTVNSFVFWLLSL